MPLDIDKVAALINDACDGLEEVSMNEVLEEALKNLYDGVSISDMRTSLVMSARTKVEKEPNYTYVTARILMDQIRSEALGFLGVAEESTYDQMKENYPKAFFAYIDKGIELDILDPVLKTFDLDVLGKAIDHTRDNQFMPLNGFNGKFNTMTFLESLGSSSNYTNINIEYNKYFPQGERNTILLRLYGQAAVGDVPFAGQNVVGRDDLRGYSNGK